MTLQRDESEQVCPPTCAGLDKHHRQRPMALIGVTDEGVYIWRCPKCLFVWREQR